MYLTETSESHCSCMTHKKYKLLSSFWSTTRWNRSTNETTTEITTVSNGIWTPPSNWTGPGAILYQSFDSSDGLELMEGNQSAAMNSVPLVSGMVSYIISFEKNNQREISNLNQPPDYLVPKS